MTSKCHYHQFIHRSFIPYGLYQQFSDSCLKSRLVARDPAAWDGETIADRNESALKSSEMSGYIIVQRLYTVLSEWDCASARETSQKVQFI